MLTLSLPLTSHPHLKNKLSKASSSMHVPGRTGGAIHSGIPLKWSISKKVQLQGLWIPPLYTLSFQHLQTQPRSSRTGPTGETFWQGPPILHLIGFISLLGIFPQFHYFDNNNNFDNNNTSNIYWIVEVVEKGWKNHCENRSQPIEKSRQGFALSLSLLYHQPGVSGSLHSGSHWMRKPFQTIRSETHGPDGSSTE